MLQLVYVSAAARPLTPADLDRIATSSERNNTACGLTGLLIYRGTSFHAVLEGAVSDVLRRMEVIITDDRHRDIGILREQDISSRRFGNWSFAALPHDAPGLASLPVRDDFIHILSQRLR